MKRPSFSRGARRSAGPWMPKTSPHGLSPEAERQAESDDLEELLAATNAKRVARGKKPLTQDDIALRVWSSEQEMRRPRAD